jgi:hypothetical protein
MADEDLEWSDELLRSFRYQAFRFETQRTYALTYERADFGRFLAGSPVPPPELDWWRPWLEEISRLTAEGRRVSRVRVLDEPPTDYQRWELWAAPWHSRAGERIAYMSRNRAREIGLPLDRDWWLLDNDRLIIMRFTDTGEIASRRLVTDPATILPYREWRDLAVLKATPAEEIAAA